MDTRPLGRTGHTSSLVIMGTAAFWRADAATSHAALDVAMENGINHIDVAPQYGNAEEHTGTWLKASGQRDKLFISCKTLERTRDGATAELERSLVKLNTDFFDLYQFHAVTDMAALDAIFAPGGALEAFVAAREAGLVKHLGITGHGLLAPALFFEALRRFDLDSVMFPINPRLYAIPEYRTDAQKLLAVCQERQVGVMVIKSVAKGPWGDREKAYECWYEPYDQAGPIVDHVRFTLSQPGVTCLASAGDVRLLPHICQAAHEFAPLSAAEQDALIAQHAQDGMIFDPVH